MGPSASRWKGKEFEVLPGTAVDVAVGAARRIANTGTTRPLTFIEVQRGDYFGEDDMSVSMTTTVEPAKAV